MTTRKARILVIDDDDSFRSVLQYNLTQAGYGVESAAEGRAGIECLKKEPFEAVITDIQMPGMDGLEVLRRVKADFPETLVIMVTAYGSIQMAVEAMRHGAYDYITKPLNREALLLTLEKALQYRDLREENLKLREERDERIREGRIVGDSEPIRALSQQIRRVADTDATVLISGETGTGKELVARAIHTGSPRREHPLVAINCAAIPGDLLESELFGHVKGAFTGASRDRRGRFHAADRGTPFLDEIGSLELSLQGKLLRVLQDKKITRLGEERAVQVDVRLVAATNADLGDEVASGRFREDLYYRLNVVPILVLPLRDRKEDLPLLMEHFVERYAPGKKVRFDPRVLESFRAYDWPGNVRELENVIERMLIFRSGETIFPETLPLEIGVQGPGSGPSEQGHVRLPPEGVALEDLETEIVTRALEMNDWNQARAARFLKIPRHILLYRMEKYGIKPPEKKKSAE